CVKGVVSW
nr:immunoglobulin heavy chain junction region [Macaca mulatta]